MENTLQIRKKVHIKFLKRFLVILPCDVSLSETNKIALAFFSLSGLDLLNALDELNDTFKADLINWIYALQILPKENANNDRCGFTASNTFIIQNNDEYILCNDNIEGGHVSMTYTALMSLVILGENLSKVNRTAIIKGIRALQQPDGSFTSTIFSKEVDLRYVYCACCVSYILNDWSGINTDSTVQYIMKCLNYDYSFGFIPGAEGHGGATYLAIASLKLMEKLDVLTSKQLNGIKRWSLQRQCDGFQGRPAKDTDTCYSFWVGAILKILGILELIDLRANRNFLLENQDLITGGFCKTFFDVASDPLHTYFAIGGLCLMGEKDCIPINPELNVSVRTRENLERIRKTFTEST